MSFQKTHNESKVCLVIETMNTIGIITVLLSLMVTGLGLRAQAMKNKKRRNMEGLSFFYFFLLSISYSFWVIYGIVLKDWVLIIPMSIGALMSWLIVLQFFIYKTTSNQ